MPLGAKKMARKRTPAHEAKPDASTSVENVAVNQGDDGYKVGPGCPPKECQFKPGESGNPHGQPKHRTHLWTYFTKYMGMTDARLAKLNRDRLTQAQQTALALVEKIKAGEKMGSTAFARYVVDREEGKAVEHIVIGDGNDLSDEECEALRALIQGQHDRHAD
jgi:hypothetical protein